MKFVAIDGKVFDKARECADYEKKLEAKNKQKELDWDTLKQKEKAYNAARKDFEEAIEEYSKKYNLIDAEEGEVEYLEDLGKIFEWFFRD